MMSWHESVEPVTATALAAAILPIPPYLLWMHGLQRLWRRIGIAAYVLHVALYATMVTLVARAHTFWHSVVWPWPAGIEWLSLVPIGLAAWLVVETYRTIDWRTLHQVRQLVPGVERTIVRDGILGRMRHPRYVAFSLVAVGNFMMNGYAWIGVTAAVTIALFWLVIVVEERELRKYFGSDFLRYRRQVPAFIPRRWPVAASDRRNHSM